MSWSVFVWLYAPHEEQPQVVGIATRCFLFRMCTWIIYTTLTYLKMLMAVRV